MNLKKKVHFNMLTDDTRPHYGNMPGVHPRSQKRVYLGPGDKYSVDGDSATQMIDTPHHMQLKEAFIDSYEGLAICFENQQDMVNKFLEYMKEQKTVGK